MPQPYWRDFLSILTTSDALDTPVMQKYRRADLSIPLARRHCKIETLNRRSDSRPTTHRPAQTQVDSLARLIRVDSDSLRSIYDPNLHS